MSTHNTFVASYAQPHLAGIDLQKMQDVGFDMRNLTIITHKPNQIDMHQQLTPMLNSFSELDVELFACIPEHDIVDYEAELGTGRLFIVVYGLPDEIEQAKRIADATHPSSWDGIADATVYYGCAD